MILPDFHLHTRFSSDSDEDPRAVADKAVSMGLRHICFTDHNDYDWPSENGEILFLLDFKEYIPYMEKLRSEYADRLDIHIGVEQGLSVTCAERVNAYDPDGRLDFIIGSSHLVDGKDPYEKEFWLGTDIGKAVRTYYESIIDNIRVCHNFDVYGHLDYIARYIPDKSYPYRADDYMDIIEEILKMLIAAGKGIELNTAGLRYGMGAANPGLSVLKLYRSLGGEIITVGSDAHKSSDAAYYNDDAYRYLKEAGFRYYTIFRSRKPEFMPLN